MLNPLLVSMAAQLLLPDWEERPLNFNTYYRNHRLIFGLLALYPLIDMLDSGLKGAAHFRSLGAAYPATCISMAVLCVAAALAKNRTIQFVCLVGVLLVVVFGFICELTVLSPM